jgi:hypothetical protein
LSNGIFPARGANGEKIENWGGISIKPTYNVD